MQAVCRAWVLPSWNCQFFFTLWTSPWSSQQHRSWVPPQRGRERQRAETGIKDEKEKEEIEEKERREEVEEVKSKGRRGE